MLDLQTKVQFLKGVGPKMGAKLNKLGIETVSDLIFYYPRDYQDYTSITKIADLKNLKAESRQLEARSYTIRGRIVGIANKRTSRRRFTVTEAVVEDDTGSMKVVWFNQPFLAKMFKNGSELILNGKVNYDFYSKDLVMESPNRANRPKIVPIYPETQGLSSYFIAKLMSNVKCHMSNLKEYLPEQIIKKYRLLNIQEAILNIHQPENSEILEKARERISFDELFVISLRAQLTKVEIEQKIAPKIQIDEKLLKEFTENLPFELTPDQKVAAWKIIQNLSESKPMNRLLNGDVGSGKTVVAAFAAYVAIKAGYRAVMMAPTEILASQHYKTCCELLSKFDISVGLITSSQAKLQDTRNKDTNKLKIKSSKKLEAESCKLEASSADLVIGTHALLQDKVKLHNIGLVIVDEQHRFGVRQRAALLKSEILNPKSEKNSNVQNLKSEKAKSYKLKARISQEMHPHFLSMTATPIPRTLYLALFADLDLSVIKTMPSGRKPIKTRVVDEANREKAYQFIREQIKAGRQAFVICPLIELKIKNEKLKITERELFEEERKSVMAEYEKLSKQIFPDLKIGMLHGRMKGKEKEVIMADFSAKGETSPRGGKANKTQILVSTSVVEVGVDIPNASIMMIEDAERFGLAQLHQFRGRVGRADHQSFCFLFSNSFSDKAKRRLQAMEQTSDGFKLAEIDLENRGAGDIFGVMQSGDLNLKIASLSDRIMIEKASSAAKEIVTDIAKYPALMEKVKEFESGRHLE